VISQNRGLMRFAQAWKFSKQGLKAAYANEEAFRQEIWIGVLLIAVAPFVAENALEFALLVGCILLVYIVELLNSAVEAAIDRIGSEQHELSGRAKDMGSAAVTFALINVAIVWICVTFG